VFDPAYHLRIVLVAPRIAANVGNVARTCEALGAELHLVGPLGFFLDEKHLKRASVGYWQTLKPVSYIDATDFWSRFEKNERTQIFWATKAGSSVYTDCVFGKDTCLIFGNEEEGVPEAFWSHKTSKFNGLVPVTPCRIPMADTRCLNLATSVGIVGYEVARQWRVEGASSQK
jgi:tRNA (cytidine/uridine-2'-O-)-methyltransferase